MAASHAPAAPMRLGSGSVLFIGVMLGASLMTMVRMAIAALLLRPHDFATYATLSATAAFLSSIISFGIIEATIKGFPRLVGEGRAGEMPGQAHAILRTVAVRALLAGGLILLAGWLLDMIWLRLLGFALLLAPANAYTAIVASMQRAAGNPVHLAAGTVLRALAVMLAVTICAAFFGLVAVVGAEAVTTVFACYLSERLFFAGRNSPACAGSGSETAAVPPHGDRGDGIRVFMAFSLITIPFYLDRLYVTSVLGDGPAGQYAVLALFLTGASLLVNTLAQRVGPDAIRLVHRDGNSAAARRQVMQWTGVSIALWLLAMAIAGSVIGMNLLPSGLARYHIEWPMLAPIAVSGILLNTALLEFLLLALDREKAFVRCAAIFAVCVLCAALAIAWLGWGLLQLMWALAGCRAIYAAMLFIALRLSPSEHMGIGHA